MYYIVIVNTFECYFLYGMRVKVVDPKLILKFWSNVILLFSSRFFCLHGMQANIFGPSNGTGGYMDKLGGEDFHA